MSLATTTCKGSSLEVCAHTPTETIYAWLQHLPGIHNVLRRSPRDRHPVPLAQLLQRETPPAQRRHPSSGHRQHRPLFISVALFNDMSDTTESAPRLRTPINEHACAVAAESAEPELSFAQVKAQPVASRLYQRLHSTTQVEYILHRMFPIGAAYLCIRELLRHILVFHVHAQRKGCMLSVPLCEWPAIIEGMEWNVMMPTSLRLQCRRNSSSFSFVVCPAPLMTSH